MFVHPVPHVVCCSSHQRVDSITACPFQEVPDHPVVGFQVADHRLDAGSLAELLPCFPFLVVTLPGLPARRDADLRGTHPFPSTIAAVGNRL